MKFTYLAIFTSLIVAGCSQDDEHVAKINNLNVQVEVLNKNLQIIQKDYQEVKKAKEFSDKSVNTFIADNKALNAEVARLKSENNEFRAQLIKWSAAYEQLKTKESKQTNLLVIETDFDIILDKLHEATKSKGTQAQKDKIFSDTRNEIISQYKTGSCSITINDVEKSDNGGCFVSFTIPNSRYAKNSQGISKYIIHMDIPNKDILLINKGDIFKMEYNINIKDGGYRDNIPCFCIDNGIYLVLDNFKIYNEFEIYNEFRKPNEKIVKPQIQQPQIQQPQIQPNCFYCRGTGKIKTRTAVQRPGFMSTPDIIEGYEQCPKCGGTGLGPKPAETIPDRPAPRKTTK